MRSRALFVVCLFAIATVSLTKAQSSSFLHLNPGGLSDLPETVPVNIVFVGYEPSLVDQSSFLSALPGTYRPIVRSRFLYGVTEELGLRYEFDYLHARAAATLAGVTVRLSNNGWVIAPVLRGRSPVGRTYAHVDRFGPGTKRSNQ